MTISLALRIAALVVFLLATLGVPGLGFVALVPLGLALWVASQIP
jgi:hypothetical protein